MEKSYIIIYQGTLTAIENVFKESNIDKYMILNEQLAVIYVPITFDERKLNAISMITHWEKSSTMSSLIQITDNLKEGETVTTAAGTDYIYKNPYITADGKGVIIAIIDSGIDYLHPDFINPDGTTKIVSIWDQSHEKQNTDEKYVFGREITREEINKAIKDNDPSLTQDNIGKGTIAAGICCGRGNLNSFYQGAAIGSELTVVKLREYKDTYMKGTINYQSADFLAAIKYAIDVANKEDKFLVINLTIGEASIATIQATMLDTFIELSKAGVVLVSGSGNEGNTDIHYEGRIMRGEQQDIIFQVGEQKNLEIVLETNGPDKITTELISPAGEVSFKIIYSPEYYIYKGTFNIEDTSYQMRYIYPWLESGHQQLYIYLEDIKPGVWTIRLNPEFIIDGKFDIYLPNKSLISEDTRFLDPTSSSTITVYALTENIITIGAYDDKIDSLWIGSSKGTIGTNNIKPDIVAPGVDIIGPFKNKSYNTATGTGASSSLVCGVLAVIMQYVREQKSYNRTSVSSSVLKTYLMLGATKQDIYNYPNISQGYGILNLSETIIQIANNIE